MWSGRAGHMMEGKKARDRGEPHLKATWLPWLTACLPACLPVPASLSASDTHCWLRQYWKALILETVVLQSCSCEEKTNSHFFLPLHSGSGDYTLDTVQWQKKKGVKVSFLAPANSIARLKNYNFQNAFSLCPTLCSLGGLKEGCPGCIFSMLFLRIVAKERVCTKPLSSYQLAVRTAAESFGSIGTKLEFKQI